MGGEQREPAVGQAGNPAHDGLSRNGVEASTSPEPDGDRPLEREGIEASMGYPMPAALETDHLLGPQGSEHRDLLLTPAPAILKVRPQGLVLHLVPSDADP